ncbi:MAG: hypothetical protein JO076_03205 [Verrucomicrobia bacterium]|nr:hypothetical protein [Verrucomicrobiota bacterium]
MPACNPIAWDGKVLPRQASVQCAIRRAELIEGVFESNVPVVIQHTRLDSWQAENAIMTTIAYPGSE